MVDSYTPSLRIVDMATGSNNNAWGPKADAAFLMLEQAIAGRTSINLTGADATLTTANNASDQARCACIVLTGTPGVARTVNMPDVSKLTWMANQTDSDVIFDAGAGVSARLYSGQVGLIGTDGAGNALVLTVGDSANRVVNSLMFSDGSL